MVTIFHSCHVMGTRFEFVFHGESEIGLRAALESIVEEVKRIESILNPADPNSEISKVNSGAYKEPVAVSQELFELLVKCNWLWHITGGMVDVTFEEGQLPGRTASQSGQDLATTKDLGWDKVELDLSNRSIRFRTPAIKLYFGEIGKGYLLDRAVSLARDAGIKSGLFQGGVTTVWCVGKSLAGTPWRIGVRPPSWSGQERHGEQSEVLTYLPPRHMEDIDNPGWVRAQRVLATLELIDKVLAVAGSRGPHASGNCAGDHMDASPSNRLPERLLGLVVADSAMVANAIASAIVALGLEDARKIVASLPITEAYIIDASSGIEGNKPGLQRIYPAEP